MSKSTKIKEKWKKIDRKIKTNFGVHKAEDMFFSDSAILKDSSCYDGSGLPIPQIISVQKVNQYALYFLVQIAYYLM